MEIRAKLSSISDAAHHDLPEQSEDFADHAQQLADALGPAVTQTHAAGAAVLGNKINRLGQELFERLHQMSRTLNDSAIALDRIAGEFAETDEAAEQWLATHTKWVQSHPGIGKGPEVPPLPQLPSLPPLPGAGSADR